MTIPKTLIALAVSVAIFYASQGRSHILIKKSRKAIFSLIKESQASKWRDVWIPSGAK